MRRFCRGLDFMVVRKRERGGGEGAGGCGGLLGGGLLAQCKGEGVEQCGAALNRISSSWGA